MSRSVLTILRAAAGMHLSLMQGSGSHQKWASPLPPFSVCICMVKAVVPNVFPRCVYHQCHKHKALSRIGRAETCTVLQHLLLLLRCINHPHNICREQCAMASLTCIQWPLPYTSSLCMQPCSPRSTSIPAADRDILSFCHQ